jgi:hypothetical protein
MGNSLVERFLSVVGEGHVEVELIIFGAGEAKVVLAGKEGSNHMIDELVEGLRGRTGHHMGIGGFELELLGRLLFSGHLENLSPLEKSIETPHIAMLLLVCMQYGLNTIINAQILKVKYRLIGKQSN